MWTGDKFCDHRGLYYQSNQAASEARQQSLFVRVSK